jgi:hypothetical protein
VAGVGLHRERGDGVVVGTAVVVEPREPEGGAEPGRDLLVRVVAGLADVEGHVRAPAALQNGRMLGGGEPARVIDLDDEVSEPRRRIGELLLAPGEVGVVGAESEGRCGHGH